MPIYVGNNTVKPSGIKEVYFGNNKVYGSSEPTPINYFYVKNNDEDNACLIYLHLHHDDLNVEYCRNNVWMPYVSDLEIWLDPNETVYFRNDTGKFSLNRSFPNVNYFHFDDDDPNVKEISVGGDIRTLLDYTSYRLINSCPAYAFYGLFYQRDHLVDASNLLIPFTSVGTYSLSKMFYKCTRLVNPPSLSSITEVTGQYAFQNMFSYSTITSIPSISNITGVNYNGVLDGMFDYCPNIYIQAQMDAQHSNPYTIPPIIGSRYQWNTFSYSGGSSSDAPGGIDNPLLMSSPVTYYVSNTVV